MGEFSDKTRATQVSNLFLQKIDETGTSDWKTQQSVNCRGTNQRVLLKIEEMLPLNICKDRASLGQFSSAQRKFGMPLNDFNFFTIFSPNVTKF